MMPFLGFEEMVRITGGDVIIPTGRSISGASIDTRSIVPGELFLALPGEKAHGHRFVTQAAALGAPAVVLDGSAGGLPDLAPLEKLGHVGAIVVPDPRAALWQLAAARRASFGGTVVAVCGSNGKTTTKNLAGAVCRAAAPSLHTHGSFNNDLGVPLTLLRLEPYHQFAVLELGMNHFGEIDRLAGLARPSGALMTNIGPEHLEGLGSIEGVAKAEGEIIAHLPPDGFFVVNVDDPFCVRMAEGYRGRKVSFGLESAADVTATGIRDGGDGLQQFTLRYGGESIELRFPLVGRHNLMNALAASALALALGIPAEAVSAGLESAEPAALRGRLVRGTDGTRLFIDCYNANPASMEAAMASVAALPGAGRLVAVLGEMKELGVDSGRLHYETGGAAARHGFQAVYAYGADGRRIADGARDGGAAVAEAFDSHASLLAALEPALAGGERILVKGSRGSRMEAVAGPLEARLTGRAGGETH